MKKPRIYGTPPYTVAVIHGGPGAAMRDGSGSPRDIPILWCDRTPPDKADLNRTRWRTKKLFWVSFPLPPARRW